MIFNLFEFKIRPRKKGGVFSILLNYPPLPTFFPRLNINVLMAKYSCKWLKNKPGMILIPVGSRRKKVGMGG